MKKNPDCPKKNEHVVKLNMFISDDKRLDILVKSLHLNISKEEHDYLVCELYRHIDHTRNTAYYNGYQQGRFDEKADSFMK